MLRPCSKYMAEIEIGVLSHQCLSAYSISVDDMRRKVRAWQFRRNSAAFLSIGILPPLTPEASLKDFIRFYYDFCMVNVLGSCYENLGCIFTRLLSIAYNYSLNVRSTHTFPYEQSFNWSHVMIYLLCKETILR